VSIISPVYRLWALWLRVSWPVADRLSLIKKPLLQLAFIHFAHWSLVTRMPQSAPWRRGKRLTYPYVLFQSNFNDDLDAYIDAFALAVPERVWGMWGGVLRFPGPSPLKVFLQYIKPRISEDAYYYCAYPDASSSMITAALELERRVERFDEEAERLGDEGFLKRYQAFLAQSEKFMLSVALPYSPSAWGLWRRTPTSLIAMMPVRSGHQEELESALAGLPKDESSPFADIESIHFARFTVLPALLDGNREPLSSQAYLIFAADFDGCLRSCLKSLRRHCAGALNEVLQHCESYPGSTNRVQFERYLRTHRIKPGFSVISYHATVKEVKRALYLYDWVREFATRHQAPRDDAELRSEWLRRGF